MLGLGPLGAGFDLENNLCENSFSEDFSDWRGVGQNVARDIARGSAGQFNATRQPLNQLIIQLVN